MEVDACRLSLVFVQPANACRGVSVWQQTKICAATDWQHPAAGHCNCSNGHLTDGPRAGLDCVGIPRRSRYSIPVMDDGVDARIVCKTQFGERVESPKRFSR